MAQFEYTTLPMIGPIGDDIREMNELGTQGWELVTIFQGFSEQWPTAYLKRLCPEPAAGDGSRTTVLQFSDGAI